MASIKKAGTITLTGYARYNQYVWCTSHCQNGNGIQSTPNSYEDDFSINGNALPTLTYRPLVGKTTILKAD